MRSWTVQWHGIFEEDRVTVVVARLSLPRGPTLSGPSLSQPPESKMWESKILAGSLQTESGSVVSVTAR